jgi:hypothetical protein
MGPVPGAEVGGMVGRSLDPHPAGRPSMQEWAEIMGRHAGGRHYPRRKAGHLDPAPHWCGPPRSSLETTWLPAPPLPTAESALLLLLVLPPSPPAGPWTPLHRRFPLTSPTRCLPTWPKLAVRMESMQATAAAAGEMPTCIA